MKIVLPEDPNRLEIYDAEGNNITKSLNIRDLSLNVNADSGPLTVQLTCYVDCVEILRAQADVTIIEKEGESS